MVGPDDKLHYLYDLIKDWMTPHYVWPGYAFGQKFWTKAKHDERVQWAREMAKRNGYLKRVELWKKQLEVRTRDPTANGVLSKAERGVEMCNTDAFAQRYAGRQMRRYK